jgi:hypothetical protein
MEGSNGYLTAGDLTARARKEVVLPSGGKVLIRRIGRSDLASIVKGVPDVTALARTVDRDRPTSGEDLAKAGSMIEGVLLRGVVTPKLYEDPGQGPTPNDFDRDEQDLLFAEIVALSKFTREEGARGNG